MIEADFLTSIAVFRDLSQARRAELAALLGTRSLLRGEVLVRQGEQSDTLFIVASGRFHIVVDGRKDPIAEIAVGQPVGEIGFFARTPRTATVVAARDSVVLALGRQAFDAVVQRTPEICEAILAALARRLAETNARIPHGASPSPARTVCLIGAGRDGVPRPFVERLRIVLGRRSQALFLTSKAIAEWFPGAVLDGPEVASWLNATENRHDIVVYVADDEPTTWTHKALRQADQVVLVASGAEPSALNPVEALAFSIHGPAHRRLVRLHDRREPAAQGTAGWLKDRDVAMHHHVALEDDADIASLCRFLTGTAIGFVAGGGGGFGAAHVGIYKAFRERGVTFDMLGGTSVGAAMMAGFAIRGEPEELDAGMADIFVTNRGFRRPTYPRYALLDHKAFDGALRRQYREITIEDAWSPFFALAADLSNNAPYLFRSGPLWKAVRASGSIPGVLPPMFSDDGRMLVDGAIMDNVPLVPMRALKAGPNLVVHFGMPTAERFAVDYDAIPGRRELVAAMLNPFARKRLPRVPGPANVIRRSLMASERAERLAVGAQDLVMTPPRPEGMDFMDFTRHTEIFHASHRWAAAEIDRLAESGDPAMTAILAAAK